MPISVLLADDTAIIRRALRTLLTSRSDMRLVGEAADFTEALLMVEGLRPNVVVMNLHMPNEFEISPKAFKSQLRRGATLLLAISIWDDAETLALADSFGASKLLRKIDLGATLSLLLLPCCGLIVVGWRSRFRETTLRRGGI
jgi:DNA-binding NarL/FixJ family response regulator